VPTSKKKITFSICKSNNNVPRWWWFDIAVAHWSRSAKLLHKSTSSLVSTGMGDHTQLNLAIPLWVGAMSIRVRWEGNCRSGVTLAMCRQSVMYPLTASTVTDREMRTQPMLLHRRGIHFTFMVAQQLVCLT